MPRYPCPKTGKSNIYPGVTTIIEDCSPKDWGPPWGANCACDFILERLKLPQELPLEAALPPIIKAARKEFRSVSQKALDIGSKVHGLIEAHLKEEAYILPKDEQVLLALSAFLEWERANQLKPIKIEQKVYGDRWAGTLDITCLFNGDKYVIDWKSAKNHYPMQHGPQIAAYRSCVPNAVGSGVLRLDKSTGMPDWKDYSKRYKSDLAVFQAMVDLYYLRHPRIAKKFKEAQDEVS